jgi:hypothetical protein
VGHQLLQQTNGKLVLITNLPPPPDHDRHVSVCVCVCHPCCNFGACVNAHFTCNSPAEIMSMCNSPGMIVSLIAIDTLAYLGPTSPGLLQIYLSIDHPCGYCISSSSVNRVYGRLLLSQVLCHLSRGPLCSNPKVTIHNMIACHLPTFLTCKGPKPNHY